MRLVATLQVLALMPPNVALAEFKAEAREALKGLPLPRNHGERMIAQALLTALSLRHLGLDYLNMIHVACGDEGLRLVLAPHDPTPARRRPGIAERAKQLIEREFTRALSVQRIARKLRVHRNQLSREFKTAYGVSIVEYIVRRRILAAAARLTNCPDEGNKMVAGTVGCRDSTFYRQFKRVTGLTPATYGRRHLAEQVRDQFPRANVDAEVQNES